MYDTGPALIQCWVTVSWLRGGQQALQRRYGVDANTCVHIHNQHSVTPTQQSVDSVLDTDMTTPCSVTTSATLGQPPNSTSWVNTAGVGLLVLHSCTHTRRSVATIWYPIPAPGPAFKQPTQQTRSVVPMLSWRWPIFYNAGPTSAQHWVNASCLLGSTNWLN